MEKKRSLLIFITLAILSGCVENHKISPPPSSTQKDQASCDQSTPTTPLPTQLSEDKPVFLNDDKLSPSCKVH